MEKSGGQVGWTSLVNESGGRVGRTSWVDKWGGQVGWTSWVDGGGGLGGGSGGVILRHPVSLFTTYIVLQYSETYCYKVVLCHNLTCFV